MAQFCAFPLRVILTCLSATQLAVAHRVKVQSETRLEADTKIIYDPFESGFRRMPGIHMISIEGAKGIPCGLKGYKQTYFMAGSRVATLEVGPTTTKIDVTPSFASLLKAPGMDSVVGTHPTHELRNRMCTALMQAMFPDACFFFAPSNLMLVCPVFAAQQTVAGLQSIGSTIGKAIPSAISDPFSSGFRKLGLGENISASDGSPCGLKGYKQTWFMNEETAMATLEVGQTTTTLRATSSDFVNLMQSLGIDVDDSLLGTHPTEDIQLRMCASTMNVMFPDACKFFTASNLMLVCPVLAAGQTAAGLQSIGSAVMKWGNLWGSRAQSDEVLDVSED